MFCGAFLEGNEVAGTDERDRASFLGMEMQRAESGWIKVSCRFVSIVRTSKLYAMLYHSCGWHQEAESFIKSIATQTLIS